MASRKDKVDALSGAGRPSPTSRKLATERAQIAGLAEARKEADRQREKSVRLKQLRLEREASEPKAKAGPARKAPKSTLNLARTQRSAKS